MKPKPTPFRDADQTPVKPGDVLQADDGRLCLVRARVGVGQQSVPGIEDLEVVDLQINLGAGSVYQTASYGRVIGHVSLKALR